VISYSRRCISCQSQNWILYIVIWSLKTFCCAIPSVAV